MKFRTRLAPSMKIILEEKIMGVLEYVLGAAILVMALFLAAAVLMQSGKDSRLSGAIAGGADTFFGKAKANTWDKVLSKLTIVISIIFVILVVALYAVAG